MSSVKIGNLQINAEGNIFTWVITQDLPLLEKHEVVVSDTFNFLNDDEKVFQFEIHHCDTDPNPINCQINPDCSCYDVRRLVLRSIEQNSSVDGWKYEISVTKDKNIYISRKDDIFPTFVPDSERAILNMCPNEIRKFASNKFDVKIECKLTLIKYDIVDINEELRPKFDFERMFLDKKFSDILIKTACGKEIPAHRILLASASPVFEAMFSHDMLENKCQLVDMVDIGYDTAIEMLRYIYTGSFKTQELSTIAELLAAADKYQLPELKKKCERSLSSNLSTENAIDILRISDTYDSDRLMKKAVDFVKHQLNETFPLNEMRDMLLGKKGNES